MIQMDELTLVLHFGPLTLVDRFQLFKGFFARLEIVNAGTNGVATRAIELVKDLTPLHLGKSIPRRLADAPGRNLLSNQAKHERGDRFPCIRFVLESAR